MKLIIALAIYWAASITWTLAMTAAAARRQPRPPQPGSLPTLNPRLLHV